MKVEFNKRFLWITITLLLVEVVIGVFVRDTFIRPFVGDVLSVCVIYAFVRIFYSGKSYLLGIAVLCFSFSIEFAQYMKLASILGFESGSIGYVMLGAKFDPLDLLAYSIGIVGCLIIDRKRNL